MAFTSHPILPAICCNCSDVSGSAVIRRKRLTHSNRMYLPTTRIIGSVNAGTHSVSVLGRFPDISITAFIQCSSVTSPLVWNTTAFPRSSRISIPICLSAQQGSMYISFKFISL